MSKWISVNDSLPEGDVPVLVTDGDQVLVGERIYGIREWKCVGVGGPDWYWDFDNYGTITHWMPLPDLPIQTNKEDEENADK